MRREPERGQPRSAGTKAHPGVRGDHRNRTAGDLPQQHSPLDDLVVGTGGPDVPDFVEQELDRDARATGQRFGSARLGDATITTGPTRSDTPSVPGILAAPPWARTGR